MRKMMLFPLLMFVAGTFSCARPKPKLGVLPSFDSPPCTDGTKDLVGDEECLRRLTAFVGRGMRGTVMLHPPGDVGKGYDAKYSGAGAVVDDRGRVLTAYSVVRGLKEIAATVRVVGGDRGKLVYTEDLVVPMTIVTYAERLDIALLEPAAQADMPVPLPLDGTVRAFKENEKVWFFGSRAITYSGPIATEDGRSSDDHVPVTIPAIDRDLGGPVLSAWGDVIGIMTRPRGKDAPASFVPVYIAAQLFDLAAARGPER